MADTPPTTGDAIELLSSDHRRVEQLFSQAASAPGSPDEDVVREIIRELSVHAAVEEQVLYPAVRRELPDGEQLADHSLDEHQEVKDTLARLESEGASGPEAANLLQRLISTVRDHVEEEETEMFPKLRAAVSAERLREMGEAMARGKDLAPTHPHPHAPNTPPGNIVGGVAAASVDKVRDALRRD